MSDTKAKLKELIEKSDLVKKNNFHRITKPGVMMPNYIAGEQYDMWMNEIRIFITRYYKSHILYNDIINNYESRNTSWGTSSFDTMVSYLKSLYEDNDFADKNSTVDTKQNQLIFISHSSKDIKYVEELVKLLEIIGVKSKSELFCSSISGYNIPTGENIFEYLRNKFSKNLHVIFLLSDNYYESPVCLNEMGATWVKSINHTAILTPEFEYSQIRGVIDQNTIWAKLNDKDRINDFKNNLIELFCLDKIDNNIWERKRDSFLDNVSKIYDSNRYKIKPQEVYIEDFIPEDLCNYNCILRFINKTDVVCKCRGIKAKIKDSKGNEITFTIDYSTLKELIIYSKENKRVSFKIHKDNIEGLGSFDISSEIECQVNPSWGAI
jgi:hypothetical protein